MRNLVKNTMSQLSEELSGRLSWPGDERYAAAARIWPKPVGEMPRAIAHCMTPKDVQRVIQAARDCDFPLSVRGGGHDWDGRALCRGLVIDLSGMKDVIVDGDRRTVQISGGARAADVLSTTDPLGLAVATGSVGAVGMTGLTLGGGYGPLIGRFGLALDNLLSAEVVLADGRVVMADHANEAELFWALRGGGGNFGAVTAMRLRLHHLPGVHSGALVYPFSEAYAVLRGCADVAASAPDELTLQVGFLTGPDGVPIVIIVPTWCGSPEEGETRLAPLFRLGTLLSSSVAMTRYGASLSWFDPYINNGQRVCMKTCSIPALDHDTVGAFIQAMQAAVSSGCSIFTHEFRGAASRVPPEETAFGLRRDHVLVEILATVSDRSNDVDERMHCQWTKFALESFEATALPGGYPNLLSRSDVARAGKSYSNARRLIDAKRHYDPHNLFFSAIPLPALQDDDPRSRPSPEA